MVKILMAEVIREKRRIRQLDFTISYFSVGEVLSGAFPFFHFLGRYGLNRRWATVNLWLPNDEFTVAQR